MSYANEPADVVIVGAGPSGAVSAKRFAQAGFSVVCLEQGDYPDYTLTQHDGEAYELSRWRHFGWNPNQRRAPADYPVNDSESDVAALMWNGVGGSSVLYAAAWHRLKPSDFRVRSLDGVADDWPLSYADLAPFYDRVDEDFSVSGVGGDPASPHFEVPLPPFPFTELERKVFAAFDRLGWHLWPGSNAIASVKHGNLQPCVRRGACMWGCFDGAKASVDRTHWPACLKLGVKLRIHARALRVQADARGLATGVMYKDRKSGETHFQPGRNVVLACNGIGTPRLLLNSASAHFPQGLANSSGLVGKRVMMHPVSLVGGLFEDFIGGWEGPFGQRAYSLQFAETQPGRDFVRGAKLQLMGGGSPLSHVGPFPWGTDDDWGPGFHRQMRQRFGRSMFFSILAEDLPDEANRVELDPTLTDDDGMPAPKLIYRASDNTRRLLAYSERVAQQALAEAGAYQTVVAPVVRDTGWHLLGSTCMGNDPRRSVVDAFGRCHDVANLFVFDGSVMPTTGCVNPTGTIAALALRNTEQAIAQAAARPHAHSSAVR